jgi:peptide/nickel transport system permease protein
MGSVQQTAEPKTLNGVAQVGSPPVRSTGSRAVRRLQHNRAAIGGLVVFSLIVLMALAAPLISPHNPNAMNPIDALQPPSPWYWMGTDTFGRDTLSRVIWGSRASVQIGFVAVAISVIGGASLGLFSGYHRGWFDMLVMRLTDVMLAFPGILLALVIIAVLGRNLTSAMIAVGISAMPTYIRVVRSSVLSARESDYVTAAQVIGCGSIRVLLRHILPNVVAPIIVLATLGIPTAIIAGASLSFLGLGVQPPTSDWGEMLSSGRNQYALAPWLSIFPGLAIVITVIAINLFGDGLRDALDPRQSR